MADEGQVENEDVKDEEDVPEAEKENPNPVLVPPVDDEGNPIEPADPDEDSDEDSDEESPVEDTEEPTEDTSEQVEADTEAADDKPNFNLGK